MKNPVQNSTSRKRQATEDLMEFSPKVRKIVETKEHSEKETNTCLQNQRVVSSPKQEDAITSLVYGDEEKHLDIRARIIMDLVVNEAKYLDDKFLEEGSNERNFRTFLGGKTDISCNTEGISGRGAQSLWQWDIHGHLASGSLI